LILVKKIGSGRYPVSKSVAGSPDGLMGHELCFTAKKVSQLVAQHRGISGVAESGYDFCVGVMPCAYP